MQLNVCSHNTSVFSAQDAVKLVQIAIDSNATFEDILPLAEKLCDRALGEVFHYVGTYMCPGILQSYGPVVTTCMHIETCSGNSLEYPSERRDCPV